MLVISLFASVCHAVYAHGCTPCDKIENTYAYHTELKQYCKCKNTSYVIYYYNNDTTKPLACYTVQKGYIVVDYLLQKSTCADGEYYEHIYGKCTKCVGGADRRTENGLCIIPDGWEMFGPNARCALGYESYSVDGKFAGCRPCLDDTYSIMPKEDSLMHICGRCYDNQFRDKAYCMRFDDAHCGKMAWNEEMKPGYFDNGTIDKTCRCASGDLPLYSLKASMYTCNDCPVGDVKTKYNGAGLPSYLCRHKNETLFNTTCPKEYPLDENTGLCSCPHRYATVLTLLGENQTLNTSECVPVILDSLHVRNCNEHGLFYFDYKGVGEAMCVQRGEWYHKEEDNAKGPLLSTGVIVGISVGVVALVALVAGIIAYFMCKRSGKGRASSRPVNDMPQDKMYI